MAMLSVYCRLFEQLKEEMRSGMDITTGSEVERHPGNVTATSIAGAAQGPET